MKAFRSFKADWGQATPWFAYCIITFTVSDLIFGIDSSIFGALQALPSWTSQFGTNVNGVYKLTTYRQAIVNSITYLGRLVGTVTFEPIVERFGYKKLFWAIAFIQFVVVIVQITAKEWIQFTAGRVLSYVLVGWIESAAPTYAAEIAPMSLRGFAAGLVTPVNTVGAVWGAAMCRAYATETRKIGWMVPVGAQMIPAVLLIVLLPMSIESPRWLVLKGRKEEALRGLRKLRTKEHAAAGLCKAELEVIEQAIEYDVQNNTARWADLSKGSYVRRSFYVIIFFFFYQCTGNSFYAAYGPTFLVSIGLGAKSFTYNIIVQCMGAVGAFIAIFTTDIVGRRPLCILGSALLILWDCLIAGLGGSSTHTTSANNVVVASFVLKIWSTKLSWATHAYMMSAELGGPRMRKKLMMVGTTADLIFAWIVSFCSPYIMNKPYGGIGGKIGYIWGGVAVLALVFAVLFLPELKGRSLEEMDELSSRFRWGWQYSSFKTTGVGARMAQVEMAKVEGVQTDTKLNDGSDDKASALSIQSL
ncbi:hypothetical protein I302_106389 [Kwoniella bestiolae CBS 10118]|uniref:Major facilitator superfamily (MFS) profile domain-containing protein n=1 Tax=Kwoniella bestiolae CBS 10118 TaxID=1296100 RepID=A0AAJ8KBK9_9TREE